MTRPSISSFVLLNIFRCNYSSDELDPAVELTPALLVLNKLVGASEAIKMAVKQAIFPPESDKVSKAWSTSI